MPACSNFSDKVQDSLELSKVRWWDSEKHSSYFCGIMLFYSGKFGGNKADSVVGLVLPLSAMPASVKPNSQMRKTSIEQC